MTDRPRILLMDHTATLGGGEIALLNLARTVDATCFELVVMLFEEGPLAERLREAGLTVRIEPLDPAIGKTRKDSLGTGSLLGRKLGKSWAFTTRLKRAIREIKPALIHTNSLKSDILGGIAGRRAGVPVVWHVRDRIVPDYLPGMVVKAFRRLARWIPRHVIAISQSVLDTLHLPESFTREKRRAEIVCDGVAVPIEHPRSKIENHLAIGIVGRISPWKGQHIFLRAAAQVREKFPAARFVIIGAALFAENEYEQELQKLTDQLKLRDAVQFTGFRTDVAELIAELDILVHASTLGEPFGQVVAEGMAAGKPVVATAGGGVPEIILDGQSGLLVPMGDASAMAAAVLRLAGDAGLRQKIGAAGRQRIVEHFTIEQTARGIESVWSQVLRKHAR